MARYEHLPIYKTALDLAVFMENTVRQFPRYHKYALGADMRRLCREIITHVIAANSCEDKRVELKALRDSIEQLKVTITLCREVKAFRSFSAFQRAAEYAVNLGRQSEGWLRSVKEKM
jgi:hypothetical protein